MKKKIFLFVLNAVLLTTVSCEKEGLLTKSGIANTTLITENAILKFTGNLNATSGISGSGKVNIYLDNGTYKLSFENYTISSGPDLKVYLSKTANTTSDFINLGSANGSSVYTIPQQADLLTYKYVLIHCQQYNHLFATGLLIQN